MTLTELQALIRANNCPSLEVHGVDASIYLVFVRDREHLRPLTERGANLSFRSRYAALKAMADVGISQVDFVHRSAYGEMIGVENSHGDTELRQTVDLQSFS